MMSKRAIEPCFCFTGTALSALKFYADTFDDAKTEDVRLYEAGDKRGDEGTLFFGTLVIGDQRMHFMDMPTTSPAPALNWATSFMMTADDQAQFDRYFETLKVDGTVMMGPEPVEDYALCAWVVDRYGMTWQLLLEN